MKLRASCHCRLLFTVPLLLQWPRNSEQNSEQQRERQDWRDWSSHENVGKKLSSLAVVPNGHLRQNYSCNCASRVCHSRCSSASRAARATWQEQQEWLEQQYSRDEECVLQVHQQWMQSREAMQQQEQQEWRELLHRQHNRHHNRVITLILGVSVVFLIVFIVLQFTYFINSKIVFEKIMLTQLVHNWCPHSISIIGLRHIPLIRIRFL